MATNLAVALKAQTGAEVEDVVGDIDVETNNGAISVQRSGGKGAEVRVTAWRDLGDESWEHFTFARTVTAADGAFRFDLLPLGQATAATRTSSSTTS